MPIMELEMARLQRMAPIGVSQHVIQHGNNRSNSDDSSSDKKGLKPE